MAGCELGSGFSPDTESASTLIFFFLIMSLYLFIYLNFYLFIYGCIGSSFLRAGFL